MKLHICLSFLLWGIADAFMGAPTSLIGRGNAIHTRSWGSGITQVALQRRTVAHRGMARPHFPPCMSLMLLGEEEMPISQETQDSIISVLSVASSALLLIIISGAMYLSIVEWQGKREREKSDSYVASTGELPPDLLADGPSPPPEDEEGNRLYRRMAKKQKRGKTSK